MLLTSKSVAVRLHRWIGLALCPWILAVATTGSVLAFRAPIEAFLHPRLYLVRGATSPTRFDLMAGALAARYPDRQIIDFERDGLRADESFHAELTRGAGRRIDRRDPEFNPVRDADLEVFLHPGTGAILGERPFWTPMRTLYWFHKELLAPFAGAPWLGALGGVLLCLVIAGLIYWWPRGGNLGRGFRVVASRGARRLFRDLHTSAGAGVAALLLVSAATGIFMCFEIRIEGVLEALGLASTSQVLTSSPPGNSPVISVQQAVDSARAAYPGFDPVVVNLPAAGGAAYGVQMFPTAASRVWWTVVVSVDEVSGKAVGLFDPRHQRAGNALPLWVIFLHNGQMFGTAGRVAVLAEGLTLSLLVLSGPWLWWARRRAGRADCASREK